MKEMLMLLASTMPKELILEKLTEVLDQYKEAQLLNDEEKMKQADEHMFISCNLFIMHHITKGDPDKAMDTIKQMEKINKARKFFETSSN